ncbi:MAG TPA: hypothetical protein ENK02_10940 [Planctomycetes bacterium]|nr:hypothetical protein [Planctomycetota bacterium]
MVNPMHAHISLLLFALLAGPAMGQEVGVGSPSSNGKIPRLVIQAPQAQVARFQVDALPPGTVFLLALGTNPLRTPMGKGIFGIDPRNLLLLGPFFADPQGKLQVDLPFPAALQGTLFHAQVLAFDPKSTSFPLPTLSDSRMGLAGVPSPYLVGAFSTSVPGEVDLGLIAKDGTTHRLLSLTRGVQVLPLQLYALSEERRYRRDLPRPLPISGTPSLRLGDGSLLLHLRSRPSRRALLLLVPPSGSVRLLLDLPLDAQGASPLDTTVAASDFGPFLAVFDRMAAKLHLLRTDAHSPGRDRILALPKGFVPAGRTLFFGRKVLVALTKTRPPLLFPLDGSSPIQPKFPSPPPLFYDEECAVSGDGSSFALGAGPGKKSKEIFVLREDGALKQITHKTTDYAEAGYGNPDHRRELVLNSNGTKVAYVEVGRKRTELFLADTGTTSIVHMTPNQVFADSIDIGTIARAPLGGGYLILAGKDFQHLDLFHSKKGSPLDVLPLTRSETKTNPPWGLGAKLRFLDLGSLEGSSLFALRTLAFGSPVEDFWIVDPLTRKAAKLPGTKGGMAAYQPRTSFFCVPDAAARALKVFRGKDLLPGGAGAGTEALPAGTSLLEVAPRSAGPGFDVLLKSSTGLWVQGLLPSRKPRLKTLVKVKTDAPFFAPNLVKDHLFFLSPPRGKGRDLLLWTSAKGLQQTQVGGLTFLLRR